MGKVKMNFRNITDKEIKTQAAKVAFEIRTEAPGSNCYPIPRGGVPAAYAIQQFIQFNIVDKPIKADFFIDDLIDSGRTCKTYFAEYGKPFYALFNKASDFKDQWLVFPWESTIEASAEDIVIRQLEFIGEDYEREGLTETPKRVTKAWREWFSGYCIADPSKVLKAFEDGSENYDQMIVVKDIPFYSHCEHHIAPFFGSVTIAYIPNKKIVGLSKFSRLVEIFARRLQVQERLTTQITEALVSSLNPLGCGCIVKARHLCMESRGIAKQGHITVTSSVKGVLRDKPEARAEFMNLL